VEGALEILRASGCSNGVVGHCRDVAAIAVRLAGVLRGRGYEVDVGLVEVGALLHDLGRARTHGIDHGVVGAEMARGLGLPEALVRVIERHIGAGIPADEAVAQGLPARDFVPVTLEERVVAYADKLTDRGVEVAFEVTLGQYVAEHGEGSPVVERMRGLHEEMSALLGR
jgi:uncharacterized protein